MDIKAEELTINGVTYVPKGSESSKMQTSTDGMQFVIVRGDRSGIQFGYLKSLEGQKATLISVRRAWYWSGAASISQMATEGVKNPTACKFTVVVPEVIILDAIEVIPCTTEAANILSAVAVWKK